MPWIMRVCLITSWLLFITTSAQAEVSRDSAGEKTVTAETAQQKNRKQTIGKQATGKQTTSKKTASTQTSARQKQVATPGAASGKKDQPTDNQKTTRLNLALPENLDAETAAVSLGDLNQSLPDLFATETDKGRLSVDGNLLVEEDLELNPGAGVDNKDAKNRDGKKAETTILDDVEGAQLNFRLKID